MDDEKKESKPFKKFYNVHNPQPPASPLLQEYMQANRINDVMPVEDGKKWFYALRDALAHKKREKKDE